MAMDDVALANYVAGSYFGHVEAGRIDPYCADLLEVPAHTPIWFSDYTLLKLRQRHGDINFSHYRHMPSILLRGFIARGRHPRRLELWWMEIVERKPIAFQVILKATKKNEIFVSTFHRIHLRDALRLRRRSIKRGSLLRIQANWESFSNLEKEEA
jgi:hypothetical protein